MVTCCVKSDGSDGMQNFKERRQMIIYIHDKEGKGRSPAPKIQIYT